MSETVAQEERVQTYRHPNGGGMKVYPAQASPDSFIDEQSSIEGESDIYTCTVRNAAIKDTIAYGSGIYGNAVIAASYLCDARVSNADLTRCHIVTATVERCVLQDTRVYSHHGNTPVISGVNLRGVRVYGAVVLRGQWGLSLSGAHIHAGVWSESPRHLLIEGEGIHMAVVECTEGRAHMGCHCETVEYWLESGVPIARRLGWSAEQIDACLAFLEGLK